MKEDWRQPIKSFTPIGCLVALWPRIPKTSGKLVLPERMRGETGRLDMVKDTVSCMVIAAGPDCKWVKEGMEVLCYNPTQLVKHKLPDGSVQTCVLIREDALGGIVLEEFLPSQGPRIGLVEVDEEN